jgi:multidrug efflux pump subunit AcrB
VPNDFFAQAVVVTRGLEVREAVRERLEAALAQRIPEVVFKVAPLELGPPIGWPVQYRVTGPDVARVRQIGYEVAEIVGAHGAASKVNFDWMEPVRTLRIEVDQDQARLLGVSSEQVADALNAVVSGLSITKIRDGIYLIEVIARGEEEARLSPTALRTLPVALPGGDTVPLLQLATVHYGQDFPLIWRRQRLPTLTVQSDVLPGTLPDSIADNLAPRIEALNRELEPGYSVIVGGGIEEAAKSQASVAAVLPLAGMLMLIALMIQLQSFNRVFLVLSVAPFGLVGVVAAMLLSGKPLGFVALLGVIALTGMIIRNSVILVDQIRVEVAHGRAPWDAVVEASANRFRPILLTAAAAILAMIPIAPTVFWGPMAYAIMGGLAVATALTLIFLPALYVAWFRIREGTGDSRVQEPALAPQG